MLKDPSKKYKMFLPLVLQDRQWPNAVISAPPIWCSVDLRDGNQALVVPMNIARKLEMFNCLTRIGFKEIEVGFPSASQVEYNFVRLLIEENRIPNDVTIQVLTQARSHLIEHTFKSLKGVKRAILHFYMATSPTMRQIVFDIKKSELLKLIVSQAQFIKQLAEEAPETEWVFEYSPEMFCITELGFAKDVCDAVVETFGATADKKVIINLPSTVESTTPNVFADQVEWMHRHLKRREAIILSVHAHNDRGTGIASAELALMAGAERLEGTLFGNGERTGNLDLVNVALNMYTQGIYPNLDFSQIDEIREVVEYCNALPVHPRHPYVGDLVYTSFSGSHQDAIKKAFSAQKIDTPWNIPYLPIDPKDLGRSYSAIIRINSQSGKGGVTCLLESEYGLRLPRGLQMEFSKIVKAKMDENEQEFTPKQLWSLFRAEYLNEKQTITYKKHRVEPFKNKKMISVAVEIGITAEIIKLSGIGNGPVDAFTKALSQYFARQIRILDFQQHAIDSGSHAPVACYIELEIEGFSSLFGVGIDTNIVTASFKAILSSINRCAFIRDKILINIP
ncbi:2-isopropylmalate synthase [Legionella lansingensis]|uniref:2-isopropylmalate synthase n=1 Tax=Legionella lansingensis TaxID=45067 RepID=A0A0W0VWA7_9GAMM|nr:2-isopropylmalate synthase [Legionella lansingensis]KTD24357.1 2-isopropylmalate synthase [Legionella lansingensis]SNV51686.1 2-isopropylmalate synthase [Legionella lansingensis]